MMDLCAYAACLTRTVIVARSANFKVGINCCTMIVSN